MLMMNLKYIILAGADLQKSLTALQTNGGKFQMMHA